VTTAARARSPADATPFVPRTRSLPALARAARACRGCHLYRRATQTVFGEGRRSAAIVLVGEQPGDREDREGRPFVGPAGRVLARGLADAKIPRDDVYVTNAVKHFKFEPRGKRRIHKKPGMLETMACHPWLEAELDAIRPRVVVCLGATAEKSLSRGGGADGAAVIRTLHPSAVLRAPDHAGREKLYRAFLTDLRKARRAAAKEGGARRPQSSRSSSTRRSAASGAPGPSPGASRSRLASEPK
jgi:DNA polymerase